jgi:lipopolysaccharide transport system permease protein
MRTIKEIYEYRQMIFGLVKKELRGRYKGSFLGFLWTFINPLLQLVVYTFVFSIVLKSGIDKYYLFLFVALIPWIFFSTAVSGGAGCILAQKGMVTKIYFPREVLPVSHVTSAFVNMLYTFIVVIIVVLFSGVPVNLLAYLCLPVIMAVEYLLALGIVLIVSAITVFFRDLEFIVGIFVLAWQFLSPVMYSVDAVPASIKGIFMFNPMTPIIMAYRDVLYYGNVPQLSTLLLAVVMGIVFLIVGFIVFGKLKKKFAEEL